MKTKSMPASLFLLCLALGFLVLIGTSGTVFDLVRLQREGLTLHNSRYLLIHTFFWMVPMAAVWAIERKRGYGLYVGLLPLLALFGFSCRFLSYLLARPIIQHNLTEDFYARMATLGFVIALATFILKLGFSKTVAAYFSTRE